MKNYVLTFVATNPHADIIMTRDTILPRFNVVSPVKNKIYKSKTVPLDVAVIDENYKYGWYSLDGGMTKIPMKQNEKGNLVVPDTGNFNLTLYSKDWAFQDSTKVIPFRVDNPTGIENPPEKPDLRVYSYPNPPKSDRIVTVVYPEGKNAVLKFYSVSGGALEEIIDNDKDGKTQIDLSGYLPQFISYSVTLRD